MKGWKTLIVNLLSVAGTLLALQGIEFTAEEQAALATAAVTLIGFVNVIVRHFTDSQPGWKRPGAASKVPVVLLAVLVLPLLSGCQNAGLALLNSVSLDPCEIGEVEVTGNFDVSSNPLVTANVFVRMQEEHTAETIPKDCPGFTETVSNPPPAS